jgi:oligoribonuclease
MKYISIDLETTGLDENNCQIIEFGAVLEDTNNILPMDELPVYHAYVTHPDGNLFGNVFALNLNAGIIEKLKNQKELQDLHNYVPIEDLAFSFMFWLYEQGFQLNTKNEGLETEYKSVESITVAGKNFSGFDKLFLNKVPNWNKYIRMRTRVLDPAILFIDWKNDNAPPSLDECKIKAGIQGVVTHLAVDDAKDVIKLLRTKYV